MKLKLTLTQRYTVFIAVVISVLILGTIIISTNTIRTGLSDLFRARLEHANIITDQYLDVHFRNKTDELNSVLTSPRLIAAIETKDKNTVKEEAPYYMSLAKSDFMAIIDSDNELLYTTEHFQNSITPLIIKVQNNKKNEHQVEYITIDNLIYEAFFTGIYTIDGLYIGTVISGINYSQELVSNLKIITGFDILIRQNNRLIDYSRSELTDRLITGDTFEETIVVETGSIKTSKIADEEILSLSLPAKVNNTTITYIASLDEHILPIIYQQRIWLIMLAVTGGFLAMLIISIFTNRSIGRQVHNLVDAAETIAAGNLNFTIESTSHDELGYLASQFEKMRSEILKSREEIELNHQEKIKSERLVTIGQLATGIIHDFKNPMAVINGTVDLIRFKNKTNEAVIKHCDAVNLQIGRMVDLTRDILEYAKGESKLEIETTDLNGYFQMLCDFHIEAYAQKGLKIEIASCDRIQVTIDPGRFQRVFDNIMNNAREALDPGDIVSLGWKLEPNELIMFVEDSGPGIPEEIKDKLFDPFVTSGKKEGTGLGLAIAKKVVEDHGASISVFSCRSKGTRFEIHLPKKLIAAAQDPVAIA